MNEKAKIYQLYGINTAIHMLRPGARWEVSGKDFTVWEDSRSCPKWEEVMETMEKIKAFEDSIETVWTDDQYKELTNHFEELEKAGYNGQF